MNVLEDSANTDRCMLYEDLSKPLKDECRGRTKHYVSWRVLVRQNVSKHFKVRQMCVDENSISKQPPLLIAQDTQ